ncbi:MAG: hypothetical protein PF440_02505 [Thiomicrorhabdus sp.]|jgi:hypothetical protein|nr:hypothetical protein [Thiomicrorhabdus sp.]
MEWWQWLVFGIIGMGSICCVACYIVNCAGFNFNDDDDDFSNWGV